MTQTCTALLLSLLGRDYNRLKFALTIYDGRLLAAVKIAISFPVSIPRHGEIFC